MSIAKMTQILMLVVIFIVIILLVRSKKRCSYSHKQEPVLGTIVPDTTEQPLIASEHAMVDTELIVFKIKPIDKSPFMGYELLQALLALDFHYSAAKIFHRYADNTTEILFSVAAATSDGTIEMNDIGAFTAPGLVLFMRYKEQKDVGASFALMVEVLKQLVDDLGGAAYDAEDNLLTPVVLAKLQAQVMALAENNQYASNLMDE